MTPDETRTAINAELETITQALARIGALVEDAIVALEECVEREREWQELGAKKLKAQLDRRRGQ